MRKSSFSRAQRGATLAEVAVFLFLLGVTLAVTSPHSIRWLSAEEARGAVYETQTLLQLARLEAVTRNRPCRFEIDGTAKRALVLDLNDPGNPGDDITLASIDLPSGVVFTDPEGGDPITFADLGAGRFGAVFEPDGVVSSGTGYIVMEGTESFHRLSLYAAGGTRVECFRDGVWQAGS